jgi:hypothetical protein
VEVRFPSDISFPKAIAEKNCRAGKSHLSCAKSPPTGCVIFRAIFMGLDMFSQAKRLLLGVTCLAFSVGPAFADSTNPNSTDPMIAYRAYDQAVAEGKLTDAAAHAQVAWKNAETTWGPTNANMAGLAFNAAWSHALIGKVPEGLDAAKRAVELSEVGAKAYKASEAQFLLAYAEFEAAEQGQKRKKLDALDKAAKAIEGSWGDMLVADALTKGSILASVTAQNAMGADLAARSLAEVQRLSPNDNSRLSMVYLAQAISKLDDTRTLGAAHEDIIKARVLYGQMQTPEDRIWGTLSAWEMVAIGLIQSTSGALGTGSRITRANTEPRAYRKAEIAKIFTDKPAGCDGITRLKRKPVGRDIEPMRVSYFSVNLGGVHVVVDLAPDGRVLNPRVTGVVPDQYYAEATLKGISTWQYELPANAPAACLKDYNITVVFSMPEWARQLKQ